MKKIGFIGLGIMGMPMMKNLLKAGYSLFVYDIAEEKLKAAVKAGAVAGSSPKDVAQKNDVIITMLPNSPHVKSVILGKEGVLEGAKAGTIIIDMSSIAPLVSIEVSKKLREKGVEMLDAPVSGGEPKAIDATLSIMVGGPEKLFQKVESILRVIGTSVILVGEIGSGNVTKLANQIIVALNIAAMSEAMALATKAGVDPEKVYNAIKGGLAGSSVLDAKMPMILDRNFKPGFRLELHIKDLINALETSHEIGAYVPLTSQVMEIMENLKLNNMTQYDHSSIVKFYEKLSNIEVRNI